MKIYQYVILMIFTSFLANAEVIDRENKDLTQFDLPFLIGDWYMLPNSQQNRLASNLDMIKLSLRSDYHFSLDIYRSNRTVDRWQGTYGADDSYLVFGMQPSTQERYSYEHNHNTLHFNGVTFTKELPNKLAGVWTSSSLSGYGITASDINQVDLILRPDFVFMFRAENRSGDLIMKQGIYYTEDDHLVLLYDHGEEGTRYQLNRDQLILESDLDDMYIELDRVNVLPTTETQLN